MGVLHHGTAGTEVRWVYCIMGLQGLKSDGCIASWDCRD